jgi:hypothetical protein
MPTSLSLVTGQLLGASCPLFSIGADGDGVSFPAELSSYADGELSSLLEVLVHRISLEPLNLFATAIFLLAVLHTFCAPLLLRMAKAREEREHLLWLESSEYEPHQEAPLNFLTVALRYLGEIEAVFGLWAIPLIGVLSLVKGWTETKLYLETSVQFTEAVFVVVVMAIAGTQPLLYVVERILARISRWFGGSPAAWWATILIVGPVSGSFITEPAAMTLCALLLGHHFYRYKPSPRLAYATVGLLFTNISVGGLMTNFAAPVVVIAASRWGWDSHFMLYAFGWKALGAVCFSTSTYLYIFRKEFRALAARVSVFDATHPVMEKSVPIPVILGNIAFLGWTVCNAQSVHMVIGGFLFFLAFVDATRHYQRQVSLRMPLLVGFFLAGLVIHGSFQGWWIEPLLERLGEGALLLGAIVLSAFNDNAAITYLASLVPHFSEESKYLVVVGAVSAGGMTIVANAPNPAGNALLSRYFEGGISQVALVLSALFPLIVNLMFFISFR